MKETLLSKKSEDVNNPMSDKSTTQKYRSKNADSHNGSKDKIFEDRVSNSYKIEDNEHLIDLPEYKPTSKMLIPQESISKNPDLSPKSLTSSSVSPILSPNSAHTDLQTSQNQVSSSIHKQVSDIDSLSHAPTHQIDIDRPHQITANIEVDGHTAAMASHHATPGVIAHADDATVRDDDRNCGVMRDDDISNRGRLDGKLVSVENEVNGQDIEVFSEDESSEESQSD